MKIKALTTIEIIIILVVLVATALFLISWIGIGSNPLEWFRKESIKTTMCSEIVERTKCNTFYLTSGEISQLASQTSTRIRNRDVGVATNPDAYASFSNICTYLGYQNFRNCVERLCNCKVR